MFLVDRIAARLKGRKRFMILREGLWKASLLGLEGGLPVKEWSEDSRMDTLVSSVLNWNLKGQAQGSGRDSWRRRQHGAVQQWRPMTLPIRYNPVSYPLPPVIRVLMTSAQAPLASHS